MERKDDSLGGWPEGYYYGSKVWHFLKRLFERYDSLVLLPGELEKIQNQVRSKKTLLARKTDKINKELHYIDLFRDENGGGRKVYRIKICINCDNGDLVTAVPLSDKPFIKRRRATHQAKEGACKHNPRRQRRDTRFLANFAHDPDDYYSK